MIELEFQKFKPSSDILKSGDYSDFVYFIKIGKVSVVDEKNENVIVELGTGSFFGEGSILFEQKSEYTYRAINNNSNDKAGDVFCFTLSKKSLIKFVQRHPNFGNMIKHRCVRRFSTWKFIELTYKKIKKRF